MGLFKLRIRALAKKKGLTLKAISAQANVPYSTVATYANSSGMATADISAVIRIAQVLGASVEDLVDVIED
ncbi:MAG: helix-turn-helix transcriptional regulator [Cyanobacteria bacterium P01_G01_bin.54]